LFGKMKNMKLRIVVVEAISTLKLLNHFVGKIMTE